MKLYQCYENDETTYYIMAHNTEEVISVMKLELKRCNRDVEEEIENFMIDEVEISKPDIICINTILE
jgi:hypothetical protein